MRVLPGLALIALFALAGCSSGSPATGNRPAGTAARTAPTAQQGIVAACTAYQQAMALTTPYARAGTLTASQDAAVAEAVQEAGPVCLSDPPDPRGLPAVNRSLSSLAAVGVAVGY